MTTRTEEQELESLRIKVRNLTLEILRLSGKRLDISRRIGEIKKKHKIQTENPTVERSLRRLIEDESERMGLEEKFVSRLLSLLLEESVRVQGPATNRREGVTILQIFSKAKELERKGERIIHLEVGEPDFAPPPEVIDTLSSAAHKGYARYTESGGTPDLGRALSEYLSHRHGQDIPPEKLLPTPGSRFGVFLAVGINAKPGCEIIQFEPAWGAYREAADFFGVRLISLPSSLDNDWSPDLGALEEAINKSTVMIVINYPNNPTGKILDKKTLDEIVAIASKNNVSILSDEVYIDYAFTGESTLLDYGEVESIVVRSFSKSFGMTGYRIGYAISDKDTISRMTKVQGIAMTSIPEFIQRTAIRALERAEVLRRNHETIRGRLEKAVDMMKRLPIEFRKPDGGFYIFPRVHLRKFDSLSFAMKLMEEKRVAIVPGSSLGNYNDHFRIAVSVPDHELTEGIRRIGEALM